MPKTISMACCNDTEKQLKLQHPADNQINESWYDTSTTKLRKMKVFEKKMVSAHTIQIYKTCRYYLGTGFSSSVYHIFTIGTVARTVNTPHNSFSSFLMAKKGHDSCESKRQSNVNHCLQTNCDVIQIYSGKPRLRVLIG